MLVDAFVPDRPQKTALRPAAALVLGMHRSGTSSISGALVRLGGKAPRHLMPATPDNPRGYWESTALMALNDEILAAGGSGWLDWRRFEMRRLDPAQAKELRERAMSTLVEEFGDGLGAVIKDPRMCRLMRFWGPVFEGLSWPFRAVLAVRSPLEVAWSLRRRDGLGIGAGCLLWLRHTLDAEADTRGSRRAVLDWSRFLEDDRGSLGRVAEDLDLGWRYDEDEALAEVGDFLSSKLRRFTASEAELHADPCGDRARERRLCDDTRSG